MPRYLMVDPAHYDVSYTINPWMDPAQWRQDPERMHARAASASLALQAALEGAGGEVERVPGWPGLPDMVFPANAAVVLDGRALLAKFRHPERRGEEVPFRVMFERLAEQGLLRDVAQLPEGCFQEGAGDCIWDAGRQHFWAGYGPRSSHASIRALERYFDREVVPLELVSDRCYHLDVGFCPLSGGEIFYLPDALTPQARATLRRRVDPAQLIEADEEDLRHFNVNAVCVDRTLIMSRTTPRRRADFEARGYRVSEVDLAPYLLSGGGAYCMTLRLDRASVEPATHAEAARARAAQPSTA